MYGADVRASLSSTVFSGNAATTYGGGAVTLYHDGTGAFDVEIDGCTFEGNTGVYDSGALDVHFMADAGTATISDSTFTGNTATNDSAIQFYGGTITVTDVTLDGNTATSSGAALYLLAPEEGDLTLDWSGGSITTNTATTGGGILGGSRTTATFSDVDLGTGATANAPEDVYGCASDYGAGASFSVVDGVCD